MSLFLALGAWASCGDVGTVPPGGGGPGGGDPGTDPDPDPNPDPDPDDPRVQLGLQALYRFDDGTGAIARDTSGVGSPLNLTIAEPERVGWIAGGGLDIGVAGIPTILTSDGPATKIGNACRASNEVTLETWVRPAAINQAGPARILTYSIDNTNRNFALAQDDLLADARLRTTDTDPNGTPATRSNITAFDGRIVHLTYVRTIENEARVYVNGQIAGERTVEGDLSNWDLTYPLAIANEIGENRPWRGEIYLAAVYCRALSTAEVAQNYQAGY